MIASTQPMDKINLINRELQILLSVLPPSRERSMVNRWAIESRHYAQKRENRLKVLTAIRDGYDTTLQIVKKTRIPLSTAYKILQRLEREESILKRKCKRGAEKTSGNSFEYRYSLNLR